MANRSKEEEAKKPDANLGTQESKKQEPMTNNGDDHDSGGKTFTVSAMLANATQLSSAQQSGTPYYVSRGAGGNTSDDINNIAYAPGIMSIGWMPTMGTSKLGDGESPLNRACNIVYDIVKQKISGSRPYRRSDLLIEQMAVADVRNLYRSIARCYKAVRAYGDGSNTYMPNALCEALGIDYKDWSDNSNRIYFWLLDKASALKPFPLVSRQTWMAEHELFNSVIYADGDITRSQLYVLRQECFWSYEVVDTVKGLTPVMWPLSGKWADVEAMFSRLYNALNTSADVAIINSDIHRGFEDDFDVAMEVPAPNSTIEIIKLDGILTAINNAEIYSNIVMAEDPTANLKKFRIEDSANDLLKCDPIIELPVWSNLPSSLINIPTPIGATLAYCNFVEDTPGPASVVMATRFKCNTEILYDLEVSNKPFQHFIDFGTEIITSGYVLTKDPAYHTANGKRAMVWDIRGDPTDVVCVNGNPVFGTVIPITGNIKEALVVANSMGVLSNFDWHPPVILCGAAEGAPYFSNNIIAVFHDIQNMVPISEQQLRQIHVAHLLELVGDVSTILSK